MNDETEELLQVDPEAKIILDEMAEDVLRALYNRFGLKVTQIGHFNLREMLECLTYDSYRVAMQVAEETNEDN